jgi:hypothetical protein
MEVLAFASFAILVVGWLVAPTRAIPAPTAAVEAEERAAA